MEWKSSILNDKTHKPKFPLETLLKPTLRNPSRDQLVGAYTIKEDGKQYMLGGIDVG